MTQDKWWDKTVTIKDAFIPTYASPRRSFHQYGLGFDIYDVTNDPINEKPDTDKISAIAKKYGFEWGDNWESRDKVHFQNTFGYDEKVFRAFMLDPNQEELNKEYQENLLKKWKKKGG